MMRRYLGIIICACVVGVCCGVKGGLTSEQLRLQRWFAQLTYLQPSTTFDGWGDAVTDVNCDGNRCIRYEISGLAYGVAAVAVQTPAYQQVTKSILHDSILRMINSIVWQYIDQFDDFTAQPTYPDPVAYKNIMYSGHLAQVTLHSLHVSNFKQMLTLYESITGDFSFTTIGWNFTYKDYDPIFYTLPLLLDRLLNQSLSYGNGGVPCEPDSIFIICNNYPQNAFLLHDATHGTEYSSLSLPLWQNTVLQHGINDRSFDAMNWDSTYFKLDYLLRPGIWEPLASVGSDAWALSWMSMWLQNTTLLHSAFTSLSNNEQWIVNCSDACEAYLHSTDHSNTLFPFSDEIATSFYPMISRQFLVNDDRVAQVNQYFSKYRRTIDSDGDGILDSDLYNTNLEGKDVGDYSVWVTANLLIGEIGIGKVYDMLKEPFYIQRQDKPIVTHVEYPHVMIAGADWNEHGDLVVTVVAGDNPPTSDHIMRLENIYSSSIRITVNGVIYSEYTLLNDGVIDVKLPGWSNDVSVVYDVNVHV